MSIPRFQNVPDVNKSGMTFENYLKQIRLLKYSLPDMYDKYFYMIHDFYLEEFSKIQAGKAFQDENYNKSQYDDLIYSLLDLFTSNFVENSFLLYESEDNPSDYMGRIMSVLDMVTTNLKDGIKQAALPDWAISSFVEYFTMRSDFWFNLSTNYPINNSDYNLQKELANGDIREAANLIRGGLQELSIDDIPPHISNYLDDVVYYTSRIMSEFNAALNSSFSKNKINSTLIIRLKEFINNFSDALFQNTESSYPWIDYNIKSDMYNEFIEIIKNVLNRKLMYVIPMILTYTNNMGSNTNKPSVEVARDAITTFFNPLKWITYFRGGLTDSRYLNSYLFNDTSWLDGDRQYTFFSHLQRLLAGTSSNPLPLFKFYPTTLAEYEYNEKLLLNLGVMLVSDRSTKFDSTDPSKAFSDNSTDNILSIDAFEFLATDKEIQRQLNEKGYKIVPI